MEILILWLGCMFGGAIALGRFNKAGTGLLLGTLLGPIGLVIALIIRANCVHDERRDASMRPAPAQQPLPPRDEIDCAYCAERILRKATLCKHCGREQPPVLRHTDGTTRPIHRP